MRLIRPAALGLVAIAVVACGSQGNVKHDHIAYAQPADTKKDPKITAAEQLSFVLCKKKQGQYKSYHGNDLSKMLTHYNIDNLMLESPEVKALARKYVNDGACNFYASYDRVWDMAPKSGDGESKFKDLIGWKRAVVVAISEGECRTRLGEFNNQEREDYVMGKLEKVSYPVDIDEEDMQDMIQANTSAIVWLALEKKNNRNCLWMPE